VELESYLVMRGGWFGGQ